MGIIKPNVPDAELPEDWGGTQYPYTDEQIENGMPEAVPTIIDGGNLNYEKRGLFQNIKYLRVFSDWLRNMPIGKIPVINSNGQLDYEQPVTLASDSEYTNGTSSEKSPTVQQVRKNTVDLTSDQTVGGVKSFSSLPIITSVTGNRVAVFNANKQLVSDSNVSTTEISYLDGLTGNIQSQLNGKTTASVIDNKINTMLSTLYPVGSVYMGTQSTCPLATLISGSKWEVVATNIVVNVNTNAPVKGTGMTLGLTDGTNLAGLSGGGASVFANMNTSGYGVNAGTSMTTAGRLTSAITFGVTTDSSKSGITATVTRTNLTINIWKRTA